MKQFATMKAVSRACAGASRAGSAILIGLSFLGPMPSLAQASKDAVDHVPFVGCKSDGQVGPLDAPKSKSPHVHVTASLAERLAYYQAEDGFGVLGPRGWHCFSTYGSNGSSLYVSPTPISGAELFSDDWKGLTGPAIQISTMIGDTSGRFQVAEVIARVFPAHLDFVEAVISEKIRPASDFPRGPYPDDKLVYRNKEVVEFVTPPNTEGLGTQSRLLKNGDPITGAATLVGEGPDLVQVSIRLPAELRSLAPAIVTQVEQEVMKAGGSK